MAELLDLKLPEVPPRSQLHYLEPIGINTPLCEGLASYIMRLSAKHHVQFMDFFSQIIVPALNRPVVTNIDQRSNILAGFLRQYVYRINGLGTMAEDGIRAIGILTSRHDMKSLTMLAWKDVISKQGLMRHHKAWCPQCYAEWYEEGAQIYDPLIWTLNAVTTCHSHKKPLTVACPSCNRRLPLLSTKTLMGYCSQCLTWLGEGQRYEKNNSYTSADFEYELWKTREAGRLIENALSLEAVS